MDSQIELNIIAALTRVVQHLNRKQNNFLGQHNLTIAQFGVLEVLHKNGQLCINDIIEKTSSTSGNMTVVIENLRKDEYVKKDRDLFDKRKFYISLTYKGKVLIESILKNYIDIVTDEFNDIKKNEKQELLNLLLKLKSES